VSKRADRAVSEVLQLQLDVWQLRLQRNAAARAMLMAERDAGRRRSINAAAAVLSTECPGWRDWAEQDEEKKP
jgi:hypothetical protein